MKKFTRYSLASIILMFFPMQHALAETTIYSVRVDGLACPYCAYGIEKKLNELKGVKFIDMDLDKGIVIVEAYNVKLKDTQLKQLFQDAGFTYRSKQERTE
ncbi:hypothetical protein MNBD_GAMMA11-2917 [hydrothermal vent metagenome]|uniref:HMA domain-containing protein n=1 Tax=hydrothermal vent metagenome TaxID=652676 RepID=A0A3B0XTS5_9ZZZZ